MKKRSFNKGMHNLIKKGYSKQSAFNQMKGLAKKNQIKFKSSNNNPRAWLNYIGAILTELILIICKVPSKEDAQISLIQTIIPLSPATQPLSPFITLLAIILQLYSLLVLYWLIKKFFN